MGGMELRSQRKKLPLAHCRIGEGSGILELGNRTHVKRFTQPARKPAMAPTRGVCGDDIGK